MRKIVIFLLCVVSQFDVQAQNSQWHDEVVCGYHQGKESIYVPPPAQFGKARTEARSKFNVRYEGFSDSAKIAFQRAVDIWESLLISPVTINIDASWTALRAGVLGSARAGDYLRNFEGTLQNNTWYPVPLAEKLAGKELNKAGDADIIANFSSSARWYFGTDGRCPADRYDLVTVVLHEIAHGLGFASLTRMDTVSGQIRGNFGYATGFPSQYDRFIADGSGRLMINYTNNSTELRNLFTSREMFFRSEVARGVIEAYPLLYAPSRFSAGSSISHLDDIRFPTGTVHSLMSPSVASGVAIHDPGALLMAMFADMGWVANSIGHTPIASMEIAPSRLNFDIDIQRDTIYDAQSIRLHYSTDNFATQSSIFMTATPQANRFTAQITPQDGTTYQYYFSFSDAIRQNRFPAVGNYNFTIATDTVAPVIIHEPIAFVMVEDNSVEIEARVSDNRGIKSVVLEYSINNGEIQSSEMQATNDLYKTTLIFGNLQANDQIRYRIVATDIAKKPNISYSKIDFHVFSVEGKQEARGIYATTFDTPNKDFVGNFRIEKPTGFNSLALHSPHPYQNAGDSNEINYIHQLRFPIIVAEQRAFMQFDEVVLVEPGENNSRFGAPDFYDYVVVEASRDNGLTWFSLEDGYDSRAYQEWLTHYLSQVEGQNSTAVGNENLYKRRIINLQKRFRAGDQILIRFRLFSDPYAVGWGWAIDNLEIQTPTVGLENDFAKSTDLNIYPNPNEGILKINAQFAQIPQNLNLQIHNIFGQKIYEQHFPSQFQLQTHLDLSHLPKGIYMVKLHSQNGEILRKISLK